MWGMLEGWEGCWMLDAGCLIVFFKSSNPQILKKTDNPQPITLCGRHLSAPSLIPATLSESRITRILGITRKGAPGDHF
jgi:hypothetical protein